MSRLGRTVLTFTAAGTASLVLLLAAFLFLPAIGAPSDEALAYSLTQEAGGSVLLGVSGCQERPAGVQICNVSDTSNSGSGRYRVRMDGGRCYHARKTSPDRLGGGRPPPQARGERLREVAGSGADHGPHLGVAADQRRSDAMAISAERRISGAAACRAKQQLARSHEVVLLCTSRSPATSLDSGRDLAQMRGRVEEMRPQWDHRAGARSS